MKAININNKDYFIKFTSRVVSQLHAKDITFIVLAKDMETLKLDRLYEAFYYSLKSIQPNLTIEDTYNLIDDYFEADGDVETFFNLVAEEYSKAMGLGKQFKELMEKQEAEKEAVKE